MALRANHPDIFPWAIRVPTLIPDRWLYLRSWTDFGSFAERTWGGLVWFCVAQSMEGYFRLSPPFDCLAPFKVTGDSYVEVAAAIDRHFRSLGAEAVPDGEWPEGGVGDNHRPDRIPFGRNAYIYDDIEALRGTR